MVAESIYSLGDHLNDFFITLWSMGLSDAIPNPITLYEVAFEFER